jgi:uncharacterized protein (TIGR03083 family)
MDQFCGLLLNGDDLDVHGIGHWSASDVAAHLASMLELYVGLVSGTGSPAATIEAVPDWNQCALEKVEDRRPSALVQRIRDAVSALTNAARSRDGNPDVAWHSGLLTPISALLALMVGEAMIHGHDIARAHRRRWQVPSAWAETTLRGVLHVVPLYFVPERAVGLHARFEIRLRGTETRASFTVSDDEVQISKPSGRRADCYISAEPTALLLCLYGRTGPLGPALTGHVVAWGPRPWLAFRFLGLFRNP